MRIKYDDVRVGYWVRLCPLLFLFSRVLYGLTIHNDIPNDKIITTARYCVHAYREEKVPYRK